MIGEGCDLGDKVTVKQCSIGKGCQIGAKSKLNNCVLMDYTIIGERCVTVPTCYMRHSLPTTLNISNRAPHFLNPVFVTAWTV